MVTATTTYDVFLSYSSSDREVAAEIARRLESAGLHAFYDECIEPGTDLSSAIWDALAECRALVAVVSVHTTPDAMGMVEIGAAIAWNKPIYPILAGPSSTQLPDALKSYHAYPRNRLDDVIQKIRTEFEPLTDHDREVLVDVYKELNVSADEIGQSARSLRELTVQFNRRAQKQLSGERVLSELLRLRKKRALPRLRG